MVEIFESLLDPFITFFTNLIDLIVNIPSLLISILRLLLSFRDIILSSGTNLINSINFLVAGYETIYAVLQYMPDGILTLAVLGIGVSSARLILDLL